jgi:Permease, similar to cation transporters
MAGPRRARRLWRYLRAERRTLTQGFVALFISSGGDLLAGTALAFMDGDIRRLPGLLILIPAAIGMRGNIFGSLGSRLGTGINAGTFEPSLRHGSFLRRNATGSWYLTLATCLYLGPAAHFVALAIKDPQVPNRDVISIGAFVTISIVGGVLGSMVVGGAAVGISILSHRHRWDLDSVSAPLVTAIGDIATLPALWLASIFVSHAPAAVPYVAAASAAFCAVETVRGLRVRDPMVKRIVRESMVVLLIAGTIDLMAGSILELKVDSLLAVESLIILVPPFLEDTNALAGILSSRIASKLHLGLIEPTPWPQALAWADIAINVLFAISVFFMVGFSANLVAVILGKTTPGFVTMIEVSLLAGFFATIASCAVAYYSAIATFRFGWDPDNHSIPISSAVMDLVGTLCLVLVILLLGVNAHG